MDVHRRTFLSAVAATGVAGTALGDEQRGGDPSTWTAGEKYGVGTAYDHDVPMGDQPKLWFTLTEGALTEIRFPRVDVVNRLGVKPRGLPVDSRSNCLMQ